MALPSDLTTITVTATYESITGTPLTGQVNFSLTTPVQDSTGKVILNAFTQPVPLSPAGSISVVLPCTDNADFNPTNFSYLVTEVIPGLGRAYYVQLPHTLGPAADLSQLAPVSAPPAATAFASANTWTATQTLSGNPGFKITTGAAAGDVLTSDAAGNATWQAAGNAPTATNLAGGATLPAYLAPKAVALTFAGGGTTLVNAALGNAFNLTLTASTTTLGNPSSPVDGQVIRFRVTQGAGGSFTLAYGTAYDFGAGSAPVLSTVAGKVDILGFEYVASISKWRYLGSALG